MFKLLAAEGWLFWYVKWEIQPDHFPGFDLG